MDSETWLEKAARLQRALTPPHESSRDIDDETAARDRVKIALWLRREFSAVDDDASNVVPFVIGTAD